MEKYSDVKESFFDSDDFSSEGYVFNEDNYLGTKLKQKYKNSFHIHFITKMLMYSYIKAHQINFYWIQKIFCRKN